MKPLKIYLASFGYYVRLNTEDFEENQKKDSLQKWIDNRKGLLPYEFIEFESIDEDFNSNFPMTIQKLGILGSDVLCHHPFNYQTSVSTSVFQPVCINSDKENEVSFFFDKGQSSKLNNYEKYYTREGLPYITKISFYIDDSTCNLRERIEYSDGSKKTSYYHLIAKTFRLEKPEYYALFDFI